MNEVDIKRHSEIIDTMGRRLHALKLQKAMKGRGTEPHILIEIEDLEEEIGQLQLSVHCPVSLDRVERSVQIEFSSSPTAKYDAFLQRLFKHQQYWRNDSHPVTPKFMASLKYAALADDVFMVRHSGTHWEVDVAIDDIVFEHTQELLYKSEQLQSALLQVYQRAQEPKTVHQQICTNVSFVRLQPDNQLCIFVVLPNTLSRKILVFQNVTNSIEFDFGFAAIINTMLRITADLSAFVNAYTVETSIHNALKSYFGYVSDYIYSRQLGLFKERLQGMTVFFEPIIELCRKPSIVRWEALARDPQTGANRAPSDIFEIANLWGRQFQLELDLYFLQVAVHKYSHGPKMDAISDIRQRESMPLHVNVYPESLLCCAYRDMITTIERDTGVSIGNLVLEISEKLPLPEPDHIGLAVDEMRWFREQLSYYTDRWISFAIDDFGVGFASTSRLSRMEPEFVKIDRDALLHHFGGFTLGYVQELSRESFGKMKMIVEGFDDQSRISLAQLYDLKVRYVQGHFFGTAQDSVYNFSQETERRIAQSLGL